MKKLKYLGDLKGLPKKKDKGGHNTRIGSPRNHVYKVTIYGATYFKTQLHRGGLNVSKYFKKKKEAKAYVNKLKTEGKWTNEN